MRWRMRKSSSLSQHFDKEKGWFRPRDEKVLGYLGPKKADLKSGMDV